MAAPSARGRGDAESDRASAAAREPEGPHHGHHRRPAARRGAWPAARCGSRTTRAASRSSIRLTCLSARGIPCAGRRWRSPPTATPSGCSRTTSSAGIGPLAPTTQLDARHRARPSPAYRSAGTATAVAAGAGGLWLLPDVHRGGIERIDRAGPPPHRVHPGGRGVRPGRDGSVGMDAGPRRRDRVRRPWSRRQPACGGSRARSASTSQRTLLPDADGAWVVGQADGLVVPHRGRARGPPGHGGRDRGRDRARRVGRSG